MSWLNSTAPWKREGPSFPLPLTLLLATWSSKTHPLFMQAGNCWTSPLVNLLNLQEKKSTFFYCVSELHWLMKEHLSALALLCCWEQEKDQGKAWPEEEIWSLRAFRIVWAVSKCRAWKSGLGYFLLPKRIGIILIIIATITLCIQNHSEMKISADLQWKSSQNTMRIQITKAWSILL